MLSVYHYSQYNNIYLLNSFGKSSIVNISWGLPYEGQERPSHGNYNSYDFEQIKYIILFDICESKGNNTNKNLNIFVAPPPEKKCV